MELNQELIDFNLERIKEILFQRWLFLDQNFIPIIGQNRIYFKVRDSRDQIVIVFQLCEDKRLRTEIELEELVIKNLNQTVKFVDSFQQDKYYFIQYEYEFSSFQQFLLYYTSIFKRNAMEMFKQKLYKNLIVYLKNCLNIYPEYNKYQELNEDIEKLTFALADTNYQLDKYDQTRYYCKVILNIKPNHLKFLELLGKTESVDKNYNLSINIFKNCLQINSEDQVFYCELIGRIYAQSYEFEKARKFLTKSLEFKESLDAYRYLSRIYLIKGNTDEAIKYCFQSINKQNQNKNEIIKLLIDIYYTEQKYEKVLEVFQATDQQQVDDICYFSIIKANSLYHLKIFEQAKQILSNQKQKHKKVNSLCMNLLIVQKQQKKLQ